MPPPCYSRATLAWSWAGLGSINSSSGSTGARNGSLTGLWKVNALCLAVKIVVSIGIMRCGAGVRECSVARAPFLNIACCVKLDATSASDQPCVVNTPRAEVLNFRRQVVEFAQEAPSFDGATGLHGRTRGRKWHAQWCAAWLAWRPGRVQGEGHGAAAKNAGTDARVSGPHDGW